MAEVVKGKLVWTADRKVRRVVFPTKKGGPSPPTSFDADQFAPALRAATDDEVEVELELEGGKPVRIRPVGQPWQSAPSPPPPRRQPGPGPHRQGQSPPVAPATHRSLDFVNPYNFVPAVARGKVTGPLADAPPVGHDRLRPDHFTGTILVRLTTKTPLLIPDAARGTEDANGHRTFPVRVGPDGSPYLAPTAVRGMLRSAYEAVTNSRLGVFAGWDRRLAFRRQAKVDVEPAIVTVADEDTVEVRILAERWLRSPAKLPRYLQRTRDRDKGERRAALCYPDRSLPAHRDHVWVRVEANGRVSAVRRYEQGDPGPDWHEGWVLVTGANINNKKAERVFVLSDRDEVVTATGPDAARLHRLWTDLIRDYQVTHEGDLDQRRLRNEQPWEYLGDEPGRTGWSRHVYTPTAINLSAGSLVYARRDRGRIVGLYPVAISRQLFPGSPLESLDKSLRPAVEYGKLSPADRVFGWVHQQGGGAHRGQLRVGPVRCLTPKEQAIREFPAPGLPLAILGQPKPQQVRFYLGDRNGRAQGLGQSKQDAGYDGTKQLRGRKVYPHHTRLAADHWTPPAGGSVDTSDPAVFREYLRHPAAENIRDNQNRSILGWVEPHTTFEFDLHITNLSEVELGALVWLLTLPTNHFHRLGLGKPLGFGSVRLELSTDGNRVLGTAAWREVYTTLDDENPAPVSPDGAKAAFETELRRAYGPDADRILTAFTAAAKGIDGKPVHYPRVQAAPNPAGEGYEWFVSNDTGEQLPLPDWTDHDPGLPLEPRS